MSTYDSALDRIRARARFAAVIALGALMFGCLFAGSLTALMHPLIAAVEQVETGNPVQDRQP